MRSAREISCLSRCAGQRRPGVVGRGKLAVQERTIIVQPEVLAAVPYDCRQPRNLSFTPCRDESERFFLVKFRTTIPCDVSVEDGEYWVWVMGGGG